MQVAQHRYWPWIVGVGLSSSLVGWWDLIALTSNASVIPIIEWVKLGGGIQAEIFGTQPWRLVTASMHHATFGHLITNAILLASITILTGPLIGCQRLISSFLTSGWVATAISMGMTDTWLVGASGGIHGILGTAVIMIGRQKHKHAVLIAVVVALLALVLGQMGQGFNPAHLLGFSAGALFGIISRIQWVVMVVFKLALGVYSLGVCLFLYNALS